MTFDNMTGITEGSYTGFCKSQLITCNFVKACNGVCPFDDALKHADKTQTMNEQHTVDHDKDWIIGCIEHDGFIHTHRFDKANHIILEALQDRPTGRWIDYSDEGYVECPFCHSATNCDGNKDELHFCFSCGAKMYKGGEDE